MLEELILLELDDTLLELIEDEEIILLELLLEDDELEEPIGGIVGGITGQLVQVIGILVLLKG